MSNPCARDMQDIRRDLPREDREKWKFLIKQVGQDVPRWVNLDDIFGPTDTMQQPDEILKRKEEQIRNFIRKKYAELDLWKHLTVEGTWAMIVADNPGVPPGPRVATVGDHISSNEEWEFCVQYENSNQARWVKISQLLPQSVPGQDFTEDQEDVIFKVTTYLDEVYNGEKKLLQTMPGPDIRGGEWSVADYFPY